MASMRRIGLAVGLGLLLMLAVLEMVSSGTSTIALQSINSGQHFLPPYGSTRDRIGFDSGSLSGYDVTQLHAGWYTNWGARITPAHPDQLVYVQTLQLTAGANPNDPGQVTVVPNKATIAQIAMAHPGSLWLLGNEPDSIYQGNPILPEVYAVLYHDYYAYIKGLDPVALIGNGGVVQPTPCRLEYLDIVYDSYLETFDEPMPVDVWNIHAFILREVYGEWGASTPVGVDPSCGIDYPVDAADDIELLLANITAVRTWMQERGYQDRPLIITEYGILWPTWFAPQFTAGRVSHFMTRTFDLFLGARDLNVGYPSDDYRLVQAWAWYSLSDDNQYNGYLFHSDSKTLSPMGEVYGAYTAAISDSLYADLSAKLVASWPSFTSTHAGANVLDPLTFTISLSGDIGNLGKRPVSGAEARFDVVSNAGEPILLGQQTGLTVPGRFEGVAALRPLTAALTAPAHHVLRLVVDHDSPVDEPRVWNNVTTKTVAILPDLTFIDLAYEVIGSGPETRNLVLTATVRNQGAWSSPAASATARLMVWPDGPLIQMRTISVPALSIGAEASTVMHFDLSALGFDLYRLIVSVDEDGHVPELGEDNNQTESIVPVTVRASVTPTSTVALTSASGAIRLVFPLGAVSGPTEVLYSPLWPADWNTGVLRTSDTAFSLTGVVDGGLMPLAFSRPISVFWRYDDAQVDMLIEGELRLFTEVEDGVWRNAACQRYQRDTETNWLEVPICHTGRFVFGYRYDKHWPLIFRGGFPGRPNEASPRSKPVNIGSPLLLP